MKHTEEQMKIVVCVKQICHIYARTGRDPEQNYLAAEDKIYRVNPYDEVALELALRIKEHQSGGQIIILTLGPILAEAELKRCLAMGADHLYQIKRGGKRDPWQKSMLLASAIKGMGADLILCGKESLDHQNGQVGAFMAHHLGIPFISAITDLKLFNDKRFAEARRNAGRGVRELIECPLPALFSVDLKLLEPRLPTYEAKKQAQSLSIQMLMLTEKMTMHKTVSRRVFPPRPRPKKSPAPDSSLPAYDRIQQLLMGSRIEKKGVMLRDTPESQAEGIISFLQARGFLGHKS